MIGISELSLLSLLCLTITVKAQVQLRNLDSKAPDSNILFAGNRNRIEVEGVGQGKVQLRAERVSVRKESDSVFYLTPSRVGPVRVAVFAGLRQLGSFQFIVEDIGEPIAQVGTSSDSIITTKELLANPGIIIKTHPLWISKLHFHSAMLKVTGRDGLLYEGRMIEARFNEEQLQAISLLHPADHIKISVFVASVDASIKQLRPITLTIR